MPRKPKKCAWKGCRYEATLATLAGEFCDEHGERVMGGQGQPTQEDILQATTEAVFEIPQVQKFLQRLAKPLDTATRLLDRAAPYIDRAAAKRNSASPPRRPQPPPRAHQPKPPSEPEVPSPRQILGFSQLVKLTPELVKERKKQLAFIFHPDKATDDAQRKFNEDAMAKINAAAKALLAELAKS